MPSDENTDAAPKLHIDSDWKAEAQAEKERLAKAEEQRTSEGDDGGPAGHELPEASFRSLVGVLASQALMGLGTMKDPQSGGVVVDLEGSRFSIDLLDVLAEKTKGNLTDEESAEMGQILSELRSRFVQVAQAVAQHGGGGEASGAAPSGDPSLRSGPAGGPLG